MTDDKTQQMKECIHLIDGKTNELLDIADDLEEHQVNVKLDNGCYLNPASKIRTKVSTLWKYVQGINCLIDTLESED